MQVTYNSSKGGNVYFMLKGGKVFGSLESEEQSGHYYNLEPCLGIKNCHLWLQMSRKNQS